MEKNQYSVFESVIPISEIFYSIQGEGVSAGTPCVFLRTYSCNLTCVWCDTKYTWLNQKDAVEGKDYYAMSLHEITAKIKSHGCKHVVVTGGEPLIHQAALENLFKHLKSDDYYLEVETNGTIKPSRNILDFVDQFNVSPKTSNSGVPEKLRLQRPPLTLFSSTDKSWFKFVICQPSDIEEVEEVVDRFKLPRGRVILMPEGVDNATLTEKSSWLVEACKAKGYRYGPRLHISLYGNRRGT